MSESHVVAVAGANGFVGRHVVRALLDGGCRVRALVRSLDKAAAVLPVHEHLDLETGEVLAAADRDRLLRGCTACINTIGIIREAPGGQTFRRAHVLTTRGLVDTCEELGVTRFIQISALGVNDEGECPYRRSKFEAETNLRRSSLRWTILRPSMILGPGSGFLDMARGWVTGRAFPHLFIPYFQRHTGGPPIPGLARLEDPVLAPVAADDVARAVLEALRRPQAVGEVYDLCGPERTTMPEILRVLQRHVPLAKKRLRLVGAPDSVAVKVARAAKVVGLRHALPFDEGMAIMAGQDSVCLTRKLETHLGFAPAPVLPRLPDFARAG
ncbi:MAG: NAD(P)H-binding protein [Phycisphaeraceae bacterium]|nr:NAD(P)H-binding protein [Phycisphaeraceae bacterium]